MRIVLPLGNHAYFSSKEHLISEPGIWILNFRLAEFSGLVGLVLGCG